MNKEEFEHTKTNYTVSDDNNELLHEVVECVRDQNKRLKRIETALLGDDEMGAEGFIDRYKRTEKQVDENRKDIQMLADYELIKKTVEENEDRINRIYWVAGIAATVITVIINAAIQYFF